MDADLDSCVPTDIITSSDKLGEELRSALYEGAPVLSEGTERRRKPPVQGGLDGSGVLLWSLTAPLGADGSHDLKQSRLALQEPPSLAFSCIRGSLWFARCTLSASQFLLDFACTFISLFSRLHPYTRHRTNPLLPLYRSLD